MLSARANRDQQGPATICSGWALTRCSLALIFGLILGSVPEHDARRIWTVPVLRDKNSFDWSISMTKNFGITERVRLVVLVASIMC